MPGFLPLAPCPTMAPTPPRPRWWPSQCVGGSLDPQAYTPLSQPQVSRQGTGLCEPCAPCTRLHHSAVYEGIRST